MADVRLEQNHNRRIEKCSRISLARHRRECESSSALVLHCVEVWQEDNLVGGIYGVLIGKIFCGESMFSAVDNGSKIAIAHLCQWMQVSGMQWLDCQLVNPHLTSLGAHSIKRTVFLKELQNTPCIKRGWSFPQQSQWTEALLTNRS